MDDRCLVWDYDKHNWKIKQKEHDGQWHYTTPTQEEAVHHRCDYCKASIYVSSNLSPEIIGMNINSFKHNHNQCGTRKQRRNSQTIFEIQE
jgi:hypothetical protein